MWPVRDNYAPDWKRETPTVSGAYYAMYQDNSIESMPVEFSASGGYVFIVGDDRSYRIELFSWWLGPLTMPTPPTISEVDNAPRTD